MFPKFHGIQLAQNSWIDNLHIERLAADPAGVALTHAGRFWYNTTDKVIRYTAVSGEDIVVKTIVDAASLSTTLSALQSNLESQISAATGDASTVAAGLAQEILDRAAAVSALSTSLSNAITQEVIDRNAAIAVAASNAADELATETTARLAGDEAAGNRADDIQAELNATQAGAGLGVNGAYVPLVESNYLDSATTLAQAQTLLDTALKAEATTRAGAVASVGSALANEAQLREDGDANLQTQLQAYIDGAITNNETADQTEMAARIAADSALQAELDQTQASIGLDTDGKLIALDGTNYMDGSTTVFGAAIKLDVNLARVDAALAAETTARQAVDDQHTDDLAAETLARGTAISSLQTEINTIEAGAGLETDGTYQAPTGTTYLGDATSLKNADLVLDSALRSENQRAISVEDGLQGQIDDIVEASGEGASALKEQLNTGRYSIKTTVAAATHTIAHNLDSDFLIRDILVEDGDGKWRADIVAVEEINKNSFRIDLSEARNVKVSVLNVAALV